MRALLEAVRNVSTYLAVNRSGIYLALCIIVLSVLITVAAKAH